MIAKWKNSIRGKLTGIIMVTSTVAVLLACVGSVVQEVIDARHDLDDELTSFGGLIAANSNAALTFGDTKAAVEILSVLRTKPSILAGCIYTERDVPFATYSSDGAATLQDVPRGTDGIVRRNGRAELFFPITRDGERIGTVYIVSDLRDLHARVKEDAQVLVPLLLVCLTVAFILSSRLQRGISEPIVELARLAGDVSQRRDYTLRATSRSLHASGEISDLVAGFNGMLTEIQQRDNRLLLHQTYLEETVALRTGELTAAKNAAEKVAEINTQLARESALILNSATDGIIGMGLDSEPSFLNAAGARMLGRSLSELQGQSIHQLIHHSFADGTRRPEGDCALGQALLRGEVVPVTDDTFWRADGSSFPVEYSAMPMLDEDGNNLGAVMTFRDVTERRAVERLKSEFVSTVSHELRTPLTSIRGALGLLGSGLLGPIAEKGQRMLQIAVSNTDRLVRLINDILDLERIESGKVELARGPVDANTVMVQALEGVQSMADQAHVRLVIVPACGALWGDSDRIIQTLTNLLGNAVKFSPPDTTVTLSGTAGETEFTFCVADQGRGVPKQDLETIFERFSQVNASDSRDKGGTGLGLAICQSIVKAHGGRIWAEANEPEGSRFQFTIPMAFPSAVDSLAIDLPASRTILLCQNDGSPNVVEILERRGFGVVKAGSSAGVAARAAKLQPDAIVLDVADGGDGLQIVEALKATAETRDIPIVVVAGQFPGSYETYAATVANWVRKPLTGDDLIHALDLACSAPSILVVEDDLDLARVMTTALQKHGVRTFHAVTGSEAVHLCKQHEPSLIVLDLVLPDMDGFGVVHSLQESATLARIPLLVYTALELGSADQSRLRLGPTEFLTKSRCSLAEFEEHVVRLLETVTNKGREGQHAA